MSNLYAINLIIPPPPLPQKPTFGVPPVVEFNDVAVIYDEITQDYITGSAALIELQTLKNTSTTKQYFGEYVYLDGVSLQTINHETIDMYCNQYSPVDYLIEYRYLQHFTTKPPNKTSNQYILDYTLEVNLQRNKFSNIEKDKVIWMMRGVEKTSKKYEYWNSFVVNSRKEDFKEVPNSRDVIGTQYTQGSQTINIHGLMFKNEPIYTNPPPGIKNIVIEATKNIKELVLYYTASVPWRLAEQYEYYIPLPEGYGIIDQKKPIEEIQDLTQIYIQKNNCVDNKEIQKLWINRGTKTDNKHYEYWKEKIVSKENTTYNVTEESKETLNSIYKKQG